MTDALVEVRRARESLTALERRLLRRSQQLSDLAARLRHVSREPVFVAPVGERSRQFVEAQSRRLDQLAERHRSLAGAVRRLTGSLQPVPKPTVLLLGDPSPQPVDWNGAAPSLGQLMRCCPGPERPPWDAVGAADEPGIKPWPATPACVGWLWWRPAPGRPVPRPVRPPAGAGWLLNLGEIRRMTARLRSLGRAIADAGSACQHDLADAADPSLPPSLRAAFARVGVSSARVCDDVDRRLQQHSAHLERRLDTPGLLGPSPDYGLSSFGSDYRLGVVAATNRKYLHIEEPDQLWYDRALELTQIMIWLCRRLPVVFGPPAENFLDLVGLVPGAPPSTRPPGRLPPMIHEPPPGMVFTMEAFVDPATGVWMGQAEYYSRYGVLFRRPVPPPVESMSPAAPDEQDDLAAEPEQTRPPVGGASEQSDGPAWTGSEPQESGGEEPPDQITPLLEPGEDALDPGSDPDELDTGIATGSSLFDTDPDDDRLGTDLVGAARTSAEVPAYEDAPHAAAISAPGAAEGTYAAGSSGYSPVTDEGTYAAGPSGYSPVTDEGLPVAQETVDGPVLPEPVLAADPQLAHDARQAVSRGGLRVGREAGAAAGSVLLGGGLIGTAVLKRSAARKITSWARYKVMRTAGGAQEETR